MKNLEQILENFDLHCPVCHNEFFITFEQQDIGGTSEADLAKEILAEFPISCFECYSPIDLDAKTREALTALST